MRRGRLAIGTLAALVLALLAGIIAQAALAQPAAIGRFPVAVAVDQRTGYAFVANFGSGTVSMLDAGSGAVLGAVHVAPGPLALAVDERRARVVVASQGAPGHAGSVSILDATQGTVLHTAAVGRAPAAIAVDEASGRAFVLNLDSSSVSVIAIASGRLIRSLPVALAPARFSENPLCRGLNDVNVCYAETIAGREITLNDQGAYMLTRQSPQGLVLDAPRHHLFIVATVRDSIIEMDTRGGALVHTIHVGTAPCALVVDPRGAAYVSNLDSNSVSMIDTRRGAVRRSIAVGQAPGPIALDQRTGQVIVDNFGDGTLSVIDARRGVVARTIGVGYVPNALAVDQRSGRVVVATLSADSGAAPFPWRPARLSVLDPRRGMVTRSISVNNGPEAVAVDARLGRAILVSAERTMGIASVPDAPWLRWLRGWAPFLPLPRPASPSAAGSVSMLDTR